jgi:glycosyltransferase involved in cell wall biosynthesis
VCRARPAQRPTNYTFLSRVEFTIAIPTHDRRETVVLSVLSALRQTRPPIEIIVLCDGCSDGTADAVRELGPDVVALELPKGDGYAYDHRNRALERARGSVILWLGDDDLLLPHHLESMGEYWDAGVAEIVTTPAAIVHPDDSMEWGGQDWSIAWHRETMRRHNTNVMSSVGVQVELARAVGGWDGEQPRLGDWDLWKRVLDAGARAAMTCEPSVLHFRATGREQAWPLRVRQNDAWLSRISDPNQLPEIRRRLRRLAAENDARQREWIAGLQMDRDALAIKVEERERELRRIHTSRLWRLQARLRSGRRLVGRG